MNNNLGILLAEDDENDVILLKRSFDLAEIRNPLYVARDGEEAVTYLSGIGSYSDRKLHPLPSLVILDIKMPKKSGLDVLQWLRSQPVLSCLPVVMLSSSAHHHDIERAYRLGANAFVVKPGTNDERTQLARYIKGFWLQFNRPPLICTAGLEEARKIHAEVDVHRTFF
jgi:CheY-like chemotaxis protein